MRFNRITLRNTGRAEETSARMPKPQKEGADYSNPYQLVKDVWYIYGDDTNRMVRAYGEIINNCQGRGVWYGNWSENLDIASTRTRVATAQEIKTMLFNQARKRGYFDGCYLIPGTGINKGFVSIMNEELISKDKTNYRNDTLDTGRGYIYKQGIWADMSTMDGDDDFPF